MQNPVSFVTFFVPILKHPFSKQEFRNVGHFLHMSRLSSTVKPGISKLFGKPKKVYYRQVVYYLAGDLC